MSTKKPRVRKPCKRKIRPIAVKNSATGIKIELIGYPRGNPHRYGRPYLRLESSDKVYQGVIAGRDLARLITWCKRCMAKP